ncbi:hypothetical protein [uncultured Campylobacter sp.]|uniref:hypothetical protein n=1 Tax=uncultured Campylobacter sp. TaxID=218934 RepID=UPI00262B62D9|nr:hypothetical protein [uncultured Campylobacter sp.]
MAENEQAEYLECPFCGKDDIKYGAVVCGGCQAEISYSTLDKDASYFYSLALVCGSSY